MSTHRLAATIIMLGLCMAPLCACSGGSADAQSQQPAATSGTDADPGTPSDGSDASDDPATRDLQREVDELTANASTGHGGTAPMFDCTPQSLSDGMEWTVGADGRWARTQYTDRWDEPGMTVSYDCLAEQTAMPDDIRSQVADSGGQWRSADWDGYRAYWNISGADADIVITQRG